MRVALDEWIHTYPRNTGWRDGTFPGAAAAAFVRSALPKAIAAAIPGAAERYEFVGSAGKGDWTHTPWVAALDPAVTTTVEEGHYVVYLMSKGCDRLYLSLNQGCTSLRDQVGDREAGAELARRAQVMRTRIAGETSRLRPITMDLGTPSWRGRLYEKGLVVGAMYETARLPTEDIFLADLDEALNLYRSVTRAGGWKADDAIVQQAADDHVGGSLTHLKRYAQHRGIERQPSHSRKVKRAQGTRCKACAWDMSEVYGEKAKGVIEAHHLTPLETLAEGETVKLDPLKDFAVLCPNCHRAIHRMEDVGDVEALRALVRSGPLNRPPER